MNATIEYPRDDMTPAQKADYACKKAGEFRRKADVAQINYENALTSDSLNRYRKQWEALTDAESEWMHEAEDQERAAQSDRVKP